MFLSRGGGMQDWPLAPANPARVAIPPASSPDLMTAALGLLNASQTASASDPVTALVRSGDPVAELVRCGERCLLALRQHCCLQWRLPADTLLLLLVHRGHHDGRVGSAALRLGPGSVQLLLPAQELWLQTSVDGHVSLVLLPLQSLQAAALELGGLLRLPDAGQSGSTLVRAGQPGVGLALAHSPALNHLLDDMALPPSGWLAERIHYHRLRLCDGLLLQLWPSLVRPLTSLMPVADSCSQQLRQLLLADLQDEPDLERLARQCGVSARTLYNRVRGEFGCTPGELIRQLRIEAVYHQLSTCGGSVTDLAIAYGFTNLGRFARQYRQHLGELPSATLARFRHAL